MVFASTSYWPSTRSSSATLRPRQYPVKTTAHVPVRRFVVKHHECRPLPNR